MNTRPPPANRRASRPADGPGWLRAGLMSLALALAATLAHGGEAVDTSADPTLEARVNRLAAELRCLVCQNQSLADSHADLAVDLKNQVREQLRAGRTEAQVIDYMTQRYGDFVLYRPPLKATTLLLWLGPLLLLGIGAFALGRAIRVHARGGDTPPLSAQAATQADALLASGAPPPAPRP